MTRSLFKCFSLITIVALIMMALPMQRAGAVSTTLVISQFQVAGGTAADEFVELHNVGTTSIDLNGYRLVYRSSAGTSDVNLVAWTASTLIPAGAYYLIAAAVTGSTPAGYDDVVPPNITFTHTGTGALSGSAGGLALRNGAVNTGTIIDSVGYGTATNAFVETAVTTAPASNTSKIRKVTSCQDTDNNSADFDVANPSAPRNLSSTSNICGGGAPTLSISDVSANEGNSGTTIFTFTVSLSAVAAGPVTFDIATADNTATVTNNDYVVNSAAGKTIAAGNLTSTFDVTVNGDTDVEPDETFFVNVTNASGATIADGQGQGTIKNDDVFECSSPYTPIYNIQGSGAVSPLVNTTVTTQGVVVGDFQTGLSGFNIQDKAGDGNVSTSDGIFVYAPASIDVAVGDIVLVTGQVAEFSEQTEISNVTAVSKCGTDSVLPTTVTLPETTNGELERYEGMLVSIPQTLTVEQNYFQGRYGQVTLGVDRLYQATNTYSASSAQAIAAADLNARSLIVLDDAVSAQNPNPIPYIGTDNTLRAGDTVAGLVGALDYGPINSDTTIRDYRLQPTSAPTITRVNARTAAPEAVGGNLKVASFNVLNYFNGDGLGGGFPTSRGASTLNEFNRQRTKIIAAITAINPDVAGLMEMENDGTGSTSAIQDLVNGLNDATAPGTYAFLAEPGPGTDEIKVAMIYKPGKVTPVGSAVNYQTSDPTYGTALFDRPPLAQTFQDAAGAKFTVIVNHFKSKGSCPTTSGPDADQGDGQGCWNAKRIRQAQELLTFIVARQAAAGDNDVLVIGDLNSYGMEDPIQALTNGGLVNEISKLIGANAYSYVFDGLSGYLDHALASSSLDGQVTGVTEWHINADEPSVIDYNTEFKPQDLYTATPYRASDHDPVIVGLNLTAPAALAPSITTQPQSQTITAGQTATLNLVASGTAPLSYQWYEGVSGTTTTPVGTNAASFTTPALNATTSYWVRVSNSAGSADSATATITVNQLTVAPSITTQPQSQTITAGQTATLNVVASGTEPLSYQWYEGASGTTTTPVGTNAASFTTPALNATTSYWVRISNSAGSTDSVTATVTVNQVAGAAVVISQVYGGGGNSGSTYTHDFIELFNRSASPVDITGWSVQYASTTGTSWSKTDISGTIQPGQYYLIQEAKGTGGTTPLPTPNATGTIAMSATNGKVVLINTNSLITSGISCPTGATVVDIVGFGTTTNCFEGSGPTANLSNTTAALRNSNGAQDTNNNSADFTVGVPNPRNTPPPPGLSINDIPLTEGDSGITSFTFTVTLSGPAPAGGVTFDIATADGTASSPSDFAAQSLTGQTIPAGSTSYPFTVQVNGDTTNEPDETFFVNVTNVTGGTLVDGQGIGTILNDEVDVCTLTYTPIYQIQGSGLSAAITGNVTTQGVVVGDFEGTAAASGFYLQDLTGDGDAATSDGIFVFTGSSDLVSVGDVVRVTGYARERFNQTTINGSNSNTAAVPAANIANCGTGSVPATDVSLPFADANFPERYEGMLVRLPQSLVISEYFNYDRFGEIVLALPLAGETRPFTGTAIDEPGTAANARTAANALSRITLDDAQSAQNPPTLRHPNGDPFSLTNRFRGGDMVKNAVGVLGYDFNLYRIVPTGPADYTLVNPRPASPEPVGGSLRVAAMNTLNFFVTADYPTGDPLDNKCGPANNVECRGWDSDQPTEFTRQRDKLLTALSGLDADVIGLNELENSTGVEPLDSIVSGLPGYDYIETGTIGTDAIKVGLIYRPAVVTPVGPYKLLTSAVDPRFIDTKSRPSLAQTFEVTDTGARFTIVVNHFKSKGSDCNDVGDPDLGDGQGNCSQTRRAAAEALVDWLATDPTDSGDPDFIIMGDLNSYAMEDTIKEIKAGSDDITGTGDDFTNLIAQYQGAYAYSYTFDGQAGYLDHALANASLSSQVTGATEWHINSDEPDVFDYDTSFKPPAQDALYEVNPYRTSDHDAVVVGLDLKAPPVANNDAYMTDEDTALNIAAPGVLGNDTDPNNDTLSAILVNNATHGTLALNADGSFSYTPNANFNGSDSFTYKANDGTFDSNVATVNITVTAVNDAPIATSDSYSTNEDTPLTVAVPGVLGNDTDVDDSSLTAVLVTGPSHGVLTLNADGSFSYTPALNYNGPDSFTYKANDGAADSNIAMVSITVNSVNDAPDAVNDFATVKKNTSVAIFILTNDIDADGDTLTVISFTQPAHGTIDYSSKNKNFRYTPAKGFSGTDTFTYTISDGHGGTDTATVTVTVLQ